MSATDELAHALPTEKRSPAAGSGYLGYSLQNVRLLARLLEANVGDAVSLGVFGDVGVDFDGGGRLAEETKSAGAANPVADRAQDLWKTLSNWVDAVRAGKLNAERTQFVLHLIRPWHGRLVTLFDGATTPELARGALAAAREHLWGAAPSFTLRDGLSDSIRQYVDNVLGAAPQVVEAIIVGFQLEIGTEDPYETPRRLLSRLPMSRDLLEHCLDQTLGWVKRQTDTQLLAGEPARVCYEDFHAFLLSYLRKFDRYTFASLAPEPDRTQIENELRNRIYVRQLDLVGCDADEKLRAASDFLRASADRARWSDHQDVHESSFDEFSNGLEQFWQATKEIVSIEHGNRSEIQRGKLLYLKCLTHRTHLQGLEVPEHFIPGSFHALANEQTIGWHPRFAEKLAALLASEASQE